MQSRVKMLEKLQIIEVDEEDTSALRLKFPPSPRSGNYPVTMEDVGKRYGDHRVFGGVNLTVERGNKIAFVGRNGEGKSTLVKCIMGEIEHEGTLTLGHNVQIGYFAQNQASLLDGELTVFQTIDDVAQGEIRTKIRDLLGAFMFGGEDSTKKVKVLSGGERTRLALLKLLLNPVNLLILDEPTNHLDLKTKDILKQALVAFDGTLIVVSHDRYFMDKVVDHLLVFQGQGDVRDFPGNYTQYREWQEEKQKFEREQQKDLSSKTKEPPVQKTSRPAHGGQKRKMTFKERREMELLEQDIAALESEKKNIEEALCSGALSVEELTDKSKRLSLLNDELDEKSMRWLELAEIEG